MIEFLTAWADYILFGYAGFGALVQGLRIQFGHIYNAEHQDAVREFADNDSEAFVYSTLSVWIDFIYHVVAWPKACVTWGTTISSDETPII